MPCAPHPAPVARRALRHAACLAALVAMLAGSGLPLAAHAQEDAGAYLAARAASVASDYAQAAQYYDRLLVVRPDDRAVQEGALISHIALGALDKARDLARPLASGDAPLQVAVLVMLADAAQAEDFARGSALLAQGGDAGQLVGGLYEAWSRVGQGQMSEAMAAFDAVARIDGLQGFSGYHRALALALVGDFEGAEAIFSGDYAELYNSTRRGVLAHLQILSQLERFEDALALIDRAFGAGLDPELAAVRVRLAAREPLPFTMVGSARDGVAELFYSVAQALEAEQLSDFALIHARVALWLRADHTDAALLSAAILEGQGQHALAISAYAQIGPKSPVFHAAEMGRAEAMVADGRSDAAIEVLEQLTRTHPDLSGVWTALGDNLRAADRFAEAAKAYDEAIARSGPSDTVEWSLWYAWAIAQERSGAWDKAEGGFRKALELRPDQPSVLNYLGYSYVEKKQNLTEALQMIEKAVAGRPDDGYITDSLGWALYRLGRYAEAVVQMERAVELLPTDALLNDHLGDVYWAVGRQREAEFQWRRALNFGPADDLDLNRVRRKLEVGLDVVLKEEGAAPLHPEDDAN